MKLLGILVTFLCLVANSEAQYRSFSCDDEKRISKSEGPALIQKVQSAYTKIDSVKAGFEQHAYLAALDLSEMSSGKVWFKKPGVMKWHYLMPEEQIFIIADNQFWLYQKADNQVIIDDFNEVIMSDLPVSFLMGIGDLSKEFRFKGGCRKIDGLVLDLEPVASKKESESGSSLAHFKLLVNGISHIPKGAEVADAGGNITSIILTLSQLNGEVKEALFAREAPRGVDVIDRRKQ